MNDLYKEGIADDEDMQSFKSEFKPKFKKFVNMDGPNFEEEPIHAAFAGLEYANGLKKITGRIMVSVEDRSSFMPGSKHNPLFTQKKEKGKGFIQSLKDMF